LFYFAKTLYLFTLSDHLTFIFPQVSFGLLGALSGRVLTTASPFLGDVCARIPQVVLWTWLHTLLFTMHNQSMPGAPVEDAINKPFRPIPAGRITVHQTKMLLVMMIPIMLVAAWKLGGMAETLFLLVGNFMYNDGRGSDNCLLRNLSIAIAFALYGSGAIEVACGDFTLHGAGWMWVLFTALIVWTTISIQDLKDQEGDAARGRKTIPLVYGDAAARWSIAVPILLWSTAGPVFLSLTPLAYLPTVFLGAVICIRLCLRRDADSDRTSWKLWSIWLFTIYQLPVMKNWML
jgi:4-hydroxybenzoate polyprenyltransferase